MKPVLYYDPRSPPVRSVLMLLSILDVEVELNFVDLFKGEQLQPAFRELNPAHAVPALVDSESDLTLTDSHAILVHLCEKYGKNIPSLWPQDAKDRLKVINMMFFEATLIFRRDSELMSEIAAKTFKNINIPENQRKIHDVYNMCEAFLKKQKFLATNWLTIADICAVTTLSTVDLMFPITVAQWPTLAAWFAVMKSMPAYEVNQKGLQEFKEIIEEIGQFKFPHQKIRIRM